MARRDDRIAEEIAFHIEQQTAKHIAAGMSPEDALRAARLKFGGVAQVREATRDELRGAWLRDFARDLRIACRSPGPRAVVLGDRDPHDRPGHRRRRRDVHASSTACCCGRCRTPRPTASCSCSRSATRADAAPTCRSPTSSTGRRRRAASRRWPRRPCSRRPSSAPASRSRCGWRWSRRDFFDVMGTRPARGRGFLPEELQRGAAPVALVGARFWERWKGDRPLSGESIVIGGVAHAVVGVMPPGFDYPARGGDLDPARAGLRVAVAHRAQLPRRRRGSGPGSRSPRPPPS